MIEILFQTAMDGRASFIDAQSTAVVNFGLNRENCCRNLPVFTSTRSADGMYEDVSRRWRYSTRSKSAALYVHMLIFRKEGRSDLGLA